MALSEQDKYALAALLQDHKSKPGRFGSAAWVGCCPRGHILLSGVAPYPYACDTLVTTTNRDAGVVWHPCRANFFALPNQDALLAAFRLGGWDAMAEAAQAMLASS